ncbi:hypothetical protein ABZ454_16405 [Streptomyces sp. NPDC005803]|uniref:hypothetical protein n=1 Tax=Streptomyces sp. NPDC005803 TaxID=3154297 RepID=UPI0033E8B7F8
MDASAAPRPPSGDDDAAISEIAHVVRPGSESDYEAWLQNEIIPAAAAFEGHGGINIVRASAPRPGDGAREYTLALRFAQPAQLEKWLRSDTRAALLARARPLLADAESISLHSGLDFWFPSSPAAPAAPRWKQWLATVAVLYPLSLLTAPVVKAAADLVRLPASPALRTLITLLINVGLLTFVLMPRWTRLIRRWLNAGAKGRAPGKPPSRHSAD